VTTKKKGGRAWPQINLMEKQMETPMIQCVFLEEKWNPNFHFLIFNFLPRFATPI